MENERKTLAINPELANQKQRFIDALRARKERQDPALQALMAEVNNFPPQAKDYLSFLTNLFLERDVYNKIMSKPSSEERIAAKLLNLGLTMEQAGGTLNYFKTKHTQSDMRPINPNPATSK